MKRVEEILRDRFSEQITLEEIARIVGIHVVHLCRQFRRVHGCTIGEYIRWLRVQKACTLLASSEITLAELALIVGCSDQSHFSSIFKRQMGVTPGQYRHLHR
jgi:AraC family transcriptional regulator